MEILYKEACNVNFNPFQEELYLENIPNFIDFRQTWAIVQKTHAYPHGWFKSRYGSLKNPGRDFLAKFCS